MPVSRAQFESRLADSGIITLDELSSFEVADDDPSALARALVEAERLTPFQAEVLLAESGPPLRLGRYLLLDRVGSGGMGQVHKAVHARMNRVVALKVLPPTAALDPGLVARFRREVEVAAKLHHPNVVTAYDADEADGVHFLVMEYVDGRDLGAVVADEGPLPVDRALACIEQAARGLAYAHGEGVLHRDVKPANLLIDDAGTVKVLDMGLARLESSEGLTTTGDIIGTATTMAPEQGDDTSLVDERSDVYGLGCTLYYLLTGKHMYEGESALHMLLAHARNPIPPLREACPDASPELEALFTSMVQKQRDDRLPSMTAVLEGIRAVRGGERPEVPRARTRRRGAPRWMWPTAAAVLLAAVLWQLLGQEGDQTESEPEQEPAPLLAVLRGHDGAVHAVTPHPDGKRLLSASGDDTIGVWDLTKGTMLRRLAGHTASVRSVLCLRDGNTVISSSDDKTIRIWDLARGTTTKVITGNENKVRRLALAKDESWFASAGKDGTLRIYDLPAGTERLVRREHGPWVGSTEGLMAAVVHPTGSTLATVGFDRTVRVWDTTNFEVQATFGPQKEDLATIAFNGDGSYLLQDYGRGPLLVRSGDGAREIRLLMGHENWVFSLAASRTKPAIVASGSEDQSVSIWNIETGEELAVLRGHEFTVGALTFSLDDKVLISGAGDETIRLWDVSAFTVQGD